MPFHCRSFLLLTLPVILAGCLIEESLIFHPASRIERTPGDVGLVFDDQYFSAADGVRLNGWFVPANGASLTLLWFHGNAGNIGHRVDNIRLVHDKVNINIFIFDYRGYGRSGGTISEEGTYRDGAAAVDFLRNRYDVGAKQLILFGRSLGAAPALEAATIVPPLAVILESPFASIRDMAREMFPVLPIGALLRTRYDNLEKVRKIKSPLLVLHGDHDEVVPFAQGKKVFDAAPEPKSFYTIVGAGHNNTYIVGGERYFLTLKEHIERAATARP